MKSKIAPGLLLCGLGIAGPVGCMGSHADPLDSRLFVTPQVSTAVDSSTGGVARAVPAADRIGPQASPKMEIPETATVLPDKPAPTPPPFDTIKPLDELSAPPATQPTVVPVSDNLMAPRGEPIPGGHAIAHRADFSGEYRPEQQLQ